MGKHQVWEYALRRVGSAEILYKELSAHPAVADAGGMGRQKRSGFRESDKGRKRRGRPFHIRGEEASSADSYDTGRRKLTQSDFEGSELASRYDAAGRGAAVEWGEYASAVARWEDILGRPAPEPLLRRVDDGRSSRVERARLSALGDGVLVQAAWFCGRRILEYNENQLQVPHQKGRRVDGVDAPRRMG